MDRLRTDISEASNLEELFPLMASLSRRTETMLELRMLGESQAQRLAIPITMIRTLLSKLVALRNRTGQSTAQSFLVEDLSERYLALEGRIKELRNDLARARKRSA